VVVGDNLYSMDTVKGPSATTALIRSTGKRPTARFPALYLTLGIQINALCQLYILRCGIQINAPCPLQRLSRLAPGALKINALHTRTPARPSARAA